MESGVLLVDKSKADQPESAVALVRSDEKKEAKSFSLHDGVKMARYTAAFTSECYSLSQFNQTESVADVQRQLSTHLKLLTEAYQQMIAIAKEYGFSIDGNHQLLTTLQNIHTVLTTQNVENVAQAADGLQAIQEVLKAGQPDALLNNVKQKIKEICSGAGITLFTDFEDKQTDVLKFAKTIATFSGQEGLSRQFEISNYIQKAMMISTFIQNLPVILKSLGPMKALVEQGLGQSMLAAENFQAWWALPADSWSADSFDTRVETCKSLIVLLFDEDSLKTGRPTLSCQAAFNGLIMTAVNKLLSTVQQNTVSGIEYSFNQAISYFSITNQLVNQCCGIITKIKPGAISPSAKQALADGLSLALGETVVPILLRHLTTNIVNQEAQAWSTSISAAIREELINEETQTLICNVLMRQISGFLFSPQELITIQQKKLLEKQNENSWSGTLLTIKEWGEIVIGVYQIWRSATAEEKSAQTPAVTWTQAVFSSALEVTEAAVGAVMSVTGASQKMEEQRTKLITALQEWSELTKKSLSETRQITMIEQQKSARESSLIAEAKEFSAASPDAVKSRWNLHISIEDVDKNLEEADQKRSSDNEEKEPVKDRFGSYLPHEPSSEEKQREQKSNAEAEQHLQKLRQLLPALASLSQGKWSEIATEVRKIVVFKNETLLDRRYDFFVMVYAVGSFFIVGLNDAQQLELDRFVRSLLIEVQDAKLLNQLMTEINNPAVEGPAKKILADKNLLKTDITQQVFESIQNGNENHPYKFSSSSVNHTLWQKFTSQMATAVKNKLALDDFLQFISPHCSPAVRREVEALAEDILFNTNELNYFNPEQSKSEELRRSIAEKIKRVKELIPSYGLMSKFKKWLDQITPTTNEEKKGDEQKVELKEKLKRPTEKLTAFLEFYDVPQTIKDEMKSAAQAIVEKKQDEFSKPQYYLDCLSHQFSFAVFLEEKESIPHFALSYAWACFVEEVVTIVRTDTDPKVDVTQDRQALADLSDSIKTYLQNSSLNPDGQARIRESLKTQAINILAHKDAVETFDDYDRFLIKCKQGRDGVKLMCGDDETTLNKWDAICNVPGEKLVSLFLHSREIENLPCKGRVEYHAKEIIKYRATFLINKDFAIFKKKIDSHMRAINSLIIFNHPAQLIFKCFIGAVIGVACLAFVGAVIGIILAASTPGMTVGAALVGSGVTADLLIKATLGCALLGAGTTILAASQGYCFGLFKPVAAQVNFEKYAINSLLPSPGRS